MDDTLKAMIIVAIGILLLVSVLMVGSYQHKEMKREHFENTIKDLSSEQKCLHICGFEWKGYSESYKFCVENCDRISERQLEKGEC